jgi:hypothetical protein
MPVWHVSVSVTVNGRPAPLAPAGVRAVREHAAELLAGVGSDSGHWWLWNRRSNVGHLRVPTTAAETAVTGPGLTTADAGDAGTWRKGRADDR